MNHMAALLKSISPLQRQLLLLALVGVLVLAAYLAGGRAKSACLFPFCRGFVDQPSRWAPAPASNTPTGVERDLTPQVDTLDTTLYPLVLERLPLPYWGARSSVEVVAGHLVVASTEGYLYVLDSTRQFTRIPLEIPLNKRAFIAGAGPNAISAWFSVQDLAVIEETPDRWRLLASHHWWHSEQACFTLRVSQTFLDATLVGLSPEEEWETLFETEPCLPLKQEGHPFAGHQAAGRMEHAADGRLLLTLGDHGYDGIEGPDLVQDPSSPLGKIHSIDLETGEATLVSLGHRNPQGLALDAEGRIWSTEHGPRGGDELNLIQEGGNYGWPLVTYGTQYGMYEWPLSATPGSHEGFIRPIYTWGTAIGIGQLVSLQGNLFPLWRGDLFIAGMASGQLFRVRIREGRVVLTESILIGQRIRDLIEHPSGALVLITDDPDVIFIRPIGVPSQDAS